MTEEMEDLANTLSEIREEKYPALNQSLVQEIIKIEYDALDERGQAQKKIDQAVDNFLEEE